jgi:hypothetical protein
VPEDLLLQETDCVIKGLKACVQELGPLGSAKVPFFSVAEGTTVEQPPARPLPWRFDLTSFVFGFTACSLGACAGVLLKALL